MPSASWKLLIVGVMLGIGLAAPLSGHGQPAAPAVGEGGAAPLVGGDAAGGNAAGLTEESPFLVEPKTVDEFFHTATVSVRLGRPTLARRYLDGMMALNPDDDTLLGLRDKYGPAVFLKFANIRELRPLSTELLDRVNAAFRRRGADPARIDLLLKDLNGTAQERDVAVVALRSSGPVVVPRMLQLYVDPNGGLDKDTLINTLVQMGPPVGPPLIGTLDSPDPNLRAMAAQVLGYVGDRATAAYLWAPAFAPNEPAGVQQNARRALARLLRAPGGKPAEVSASGVMEELRRIAYRHYRRDHEWPITEDKLVELWSWDKETNTVVLNRVPAEAASLQEGGRFARQALAISPENPEMQSLVLSLALAQDAYDAGWDRPIAAGPGSTHDVGLSAGAVTVSRALDVAMQTSNPQAAVAALQVLGQVGTKNDLNMAGPNKSALMAALNYPDARVQFSAAMAILQIDPGQQFRGAERVVAILSRALSDSGERHCLVVHPNGEKAGSVAGLFGEMGYLPLTAATGREGFRLATERPDVELILLDYNTIQWDISQTVANLRADVRTASTPIVVFGPESRQATLAPLIKRHRHMAYLVESTTAENVRLQLNSFFAARATPPMTADARAEQASIAAYWLAHIAAGERANVYPVKNAEKALLSAGDVPALSENVMRALGSLGTKNAQESLLQTAVTAGNDARTRELAAAQLALHIQRFGLLMGSDKTRLIEPAWRAEQDPAVSSALAAVVGSLKPNAKLVSDRLKQIAPTSRPARPPAGGGPANPAAPDAAAPNAAAPDTAN